MTAPTMTGKSATVITCDHADGCDGRIVVHAVSALTVRREATDRGWSFERPDRGHMLDLCPQHRTKRPVGIVDRIPAPRQPEPEPEPVPVEPTGPDASAALIRRAQAGDREAFGQLYARYHRPVLGYVLRRTGNYDFAQDIVQDVFVRALNSIGRYEDQGRDYGAFLMTIARNIIIDRGRSGFHCYERPAFDNETFDREEPEPGPEKLALRNDVRAVALDAMTALTDKQRDVVIARYFNDLDTNETALALGTDPTAVKALLYRATRAMAAVMPPNTIELLRS